MIQFKRGSTKSWRSSKIKLAAGQPGYDKDKHKIKVGDGEKDWSTLPYATGLFAEEILNSEAQAKVRKARDAEDTTIITYGTAIPDESTVGQLYLQHYETEPEVDYVISAGINGIWTYQKWKSGIARCWGQIPVTTAIQTAIEGTGLFQESIPTTSVSYPFNFSEVPTETASIQSSGGIVLLTNKGKNTVSTTGTYTILSVDEQIAPADHLISLQVEGLWR